MSQLTTIAEALNKLNHTLSNNENRNEKVLKENEKLRDKILEKQVAIHRRQLRILFASALFIVFFLLISAIYLKVLVKELRQKRYEETSEIIHKERVKQTNEIFMDMWKWYYTAIKEDDVFRKFAANKYRRTFSETGRWENNNNTNNARSNESAAIESYGNADNFARDSLSFMQSQYINRFYNYFEILKTYDEASLIDFQTAENQLAFFKDIGRDFNYIEKVRLSIHHSICGDNSDRKCPECKCGEILDGYQYVLNKFLHLEVPQTRTHCESDEN